MQIVAGEQVELVLAVVVLAEGALHLEVVAPAAQLQALVAPLAPPLAASSSSGRSAQGPVNRMTGRGIGGLLPVCPRPACRTQMNQTCSGEYLEMNSYGWHALRSTSGRATQVRVFDRAGTSALSTPGFWGAVLARGRENPRPGERGYPEFER